MAGSASPSLPAAAAAAAVAAAVAALDERPVVPHSSEPVRQPALDPASDVSRRDDQTDVVPLILHKRLLVLFDSDSVMRACAVTREWENISATVRALAAAVETQLAWHTLSPTTQAELRNWAPKAQDYMESEHTGVCKVKEPPRRPSPSPSCATIHVLY
jgi:hypothetical protein